MCWKQSPIRLAAKGNIEPILLKKSSIDRGYFGTFAAGHLSAKGGKRSFAAYAHWSPKFTKQTWTMLNNANEMINHTAEI